ncbi:response regulator [uncultured Ilyobacter sp.]|uniref:response regulator n=1 Tax=uncultured Ilyobacter sp. TaxID=544433 RepID=UPI002AA942B3|nr:response regulator [uncultured Ilyobacter sp.]
MTGKVLFVDDQQDFLKLLEVKLKNEKYQMFFTDKSEDVLKIIEKEDIDVVVSDINMPKSGIELFKELRRQHPNVVRVALSGFINPRNLLAAINEGDVHKYITKPWKIDEKGKRIIEEALDYSSYLKFKFYCDCSVDVVSLEKLSEILKVTGNKHQIKPYSEEYKDCLKLNSNYVLLLER